jgi:hypothetical protein
MDADMSRAMKFHHRERLMANRRFWWGRDLRDTPEHLSKAVNTKMPCSCPMCGNQRYAKGKPLHERRADSRAQDQYE